MLNTTLTVREKVAGSHQKLGWEDFTDSVIKKISYKKRRNSFFTVGCFCSKKIRIN
jgi:uracil-DNA glycosylase